MSKNAIERDAEMEQKSKNFLEEIEKLSDMKVDIMKKYNDLLNLYTSFNYNLGKVNNLAAEVQKEKKEKLQENNKKENSLIFEKIK